MWHPDRQEEDALDLELDVRDLGTLDLEGAWVPYADLHEGDFMPTRLKVGADEYAFDSSVIIKGHGATLPQRIKGLRASGKKPMVVERGDRYYVFVTPP
jgi:hypothetical protein